MKKRVLLTLLVLALMMTAAVSVSAATNYSGVTSPALMYDVNGDGDYDDADDFQGEELYHAASGITFKSSDYGGYIKSVDSKTITVAGLSTGKLYYKASTASSFDSKSLTINTVVNGEYTITGLEEGVTYDIAIEWPLKTVGADRFRFIQSASIQVTTKSLLDGGKWDAPEGLSTKNGKLIGAETDKTYEYAKLEIPDFTPGTYSTYSGDTLTAGLWAVRVAEGDDGTYLYAASDPAIVYVAGANVGTLSYLHQNYSGPFEYVSGKWASPWSASSNATYGGFQSYITYADLQSYFSTPYVYQLTDDEVIPVADLLSFKLERSYGTGGHIFSSPATTFGKVVFHVYDGDVDSYDVYFEYESSGTVQQDVIDLKAVAGANAKGYVYKIDIYPVALEKMTDYQIKPETEFYNSYSYQNIKFGNLNNTTQRFALASRVAAPAPTLSAEGTSVEGEYKIFGLDSKYTYMMSTNGTSFSELESGISSVTVNSTGTYHFYVKGGADYYESDVSKITISGAMPVPTHLELGFMGDSYYVSGFSTIPSEYSVLKYEWCKVAIDGTLAWEPRLSTDGDVLTGLGYGCYAFRYAANGNDVAGAPLYIFIYEGGSDKGTINTTCATGTDFIQGSWTSSLGNARIYTETGMNYLMSYIEGVELLDGNHPQDISWRYAMTDAQVFPLSELGSIKTKIGFYAGNPFNSDYYGYINVYVADGEKNVYTVPFIATNNTDFTVDFAATWADEVASDPDFAPSGYVVGLEVFYFDEAYTEGLVVSDKHLGNLYLSMTWGGHDPSTMKGTIGLKKDVDVSTISAVPAVGTYGGEIVGLDPNARYQWAEYDIASGENTSIWYNIAPNSTYVNLPAGTYAIRAYSDATDPNFILSEPVICTIKESIPDDTRQSARVSKTILPEDVTYANADYIFDIDQSRWINRLAISNIAVTSPDATVVFEADKYRYTIKASDINMDLDTAHYFDMKVTFDGESSYDRMYDKMVLLADEKELVLGIHFETSTDYFFETATFDVFVGEKYDGYEVDLRSYNNRVNRLRKEETATVEDGWVSFSTFGGDYLVLSPSFAEDAE